LLLLLLLGLLVAFAEVVVASCVVFVVARVAG
jgi:hypothetical protein